MKASALRFATATLIAAIAFAADLAEACFTMPECEALAPINRPTCCCTGATIGLYTPPYADTNSCLGLPPGPPPPPPATCGDAGYINDPGALCPGARCTGMTIGGFNCACPLPTQFWDGDACLPTAATVWADHQCRNAGIAPSPGIPVGFDSNQMANAKLACCLNGWWEGGLGTQKIDCLSTPTTIREFNQLYSYNYTGADPFLQDGLTRPNRVFIRDSVTGEPIPGFYNSNNRRCAYLDAGGNPTQLTIQQQYDLFDMAIANRSVPIPVVPPTCTRLIRTAIQTACPTVNPHLSTGIIWTATSGSERRCTAAAEIKLHIALDDLSSSTTSGRPTYHRVTTYDPNFTLSGQSLIDYVAGNSITFDRWIEQITPGSCLGSPGLSFVGGKCEIKNTP